MKPGVSMAVSVCRGILISGAFILALPAVFGGDSVWWAMPITETLVAAYVIFSLARENKKEKIPMRSEERRDFFILLFYAIMI